jgi:raffinose/stachyose/melibiose transport system permease protein
LYNFYYSFFDWKGIAFPRVFGGLINYKEALKDPVILVVIKNTVVYMVITTVFRMMLGMYMAYILKCGIPLGGFYKTIMYIPAIISYAILGIVFIHMLDVNYGELGEIAKFLGLEIKKPPLAYPNSALASIIALTVWKWSGYNMVLYYSAMLSISDEIIEAAIIDGAPRRVVFFRILFPMLRSTHYTSCILCILGALKAFDNVWTLTGGGPGHSTHFFSTYIYFKSIWQGAIGYASALSTILVILSLSITIFQIRQYNKATSGFSL